MKTTKYESAQLPATADAANALAAQYEEWAKEARTKDMHGSAHNFELAALLLRDYAAKSERPIELAWKEYASIAAVHYDAMGRLSADDALSWQEISQGDRDLHTAGIAKLFEDSDQICRALALTLAATNKEGVLTTC